MKGKAKMGDVGDGLEKQAKAMEVKVGRVIMIPYGIKVCVLLSDIMALSYKWYSSLNR